MLQKNKLSYLILFFALLVAVFVVLISENKTRSLFIFLYFPLAVLFATFFEKVKKKTIQTIIIYTMLILSVVFGLLSVQ
jgi:carbon starvation protein CstA